MSLPYALRVVCLLLVVVGLLNATLAGALTAGAQGLLRLLDPRSARRRERVLYLIHIAPLAAAMLFAGACCIPEYLRHEPEHGAEGVSWLCLLLAAATLVWFGSAAIRGSRALLRTLRFTRTIRRTGREEPRVSAAPGTLVVPEKRPIMALIGWVRPVVLISRPLMDALDKRALAVALDHERAHAAQMDNWKLLSLTFLPRLPFAIAGGDRWMRLWQEAAEWAADEDATGGDTERRLLLAETLVRVARGTGGREVGRRGPAIIQTALSCGEAGLEARVTRLLRNPGDERSPAGGTHRAIVFLLCAVAVAAAGMVLAFSPWIYAVSESLLHLG